MAPNGHYSCVNHVANSPQASETIFRMKVSRNEVQPVKHGEVILFSVTTALFMYLIRRSGYLNDPVSKAFQFIVGKEEFVKGSSSPSPLGSPTPPSSVDASDNAGPATQELQAAWAYASQVLDDQSSWTQKQLAALGLNSRHWSCGHKRGCLAHVAHLVSCLLRWTGDGASDWHALPAGLLAGLAMFWYPSPSMALYLTWKLVEAVFEPHNLRPTYWAFLNRLSSRRFSLLNRHVYDMFGVHSSKLFDDFWPKLDLKYTTRKFQESVLVWVPF
ncbi:hypothetical protein IscW_ISCW001018 [Ixodes scapularis]|uniref:Uncharacterized protein n=1 Tax=Ixodes scapularis TaxID=6945 RepID=B7P253_IXOSC|nr:hypothetical protein IscW_ISCW001018 [Ixodes scapularis]|eukprot:XP_002401499.1 hypothetical protein IscW_ISCW001018 [Ixodes scapularis]